MQSPEAKDWQFDIDRYINPYLPRYYLQVLPKPLSHFLGYRDRPRRQVGTLIVAAWAFLGALVGVIAIEAVFMIPTIQEHGVPLIIASCVCLLTVRWILSRSPQAGRCSYSGVQCYRVSFRPASKRNSRTHLVRSCGHRDHEAFLPQSRIRESTMACWGSCLWIGVSSDDTHENDTSSRRGDCVAGGRRSAG